MRAPAGKNAVVIGAGMGGLAAAAVLADHFERVTVLERDELPRDASTRAGTPQSYHLHGLLGGGLRALGLLFPGFDRDLIQAGAVPFRAGFDIREELPGYDPFPQRDLGWTGYSMSRPVIELTVRRRVSQLPNVALREYCRALDIVASDRGVVTGVRCKAIGGPDETLLADLVVDASARGSFTLSLLKSMGLPPVEQTTIGVDVNYATTTFAIPDGHRDWKAVMAFPDGPADTKTGYLVSVEGGRWMALISERHGTMISADADEFMDFVWRLRTPTIYDAIKHAKRLDKIHRFCFPESSWRHYERLGDFPPGLLPIGDAICRTNPAYGQGMTVAVQEALILQTLLQERGPSTGLGQAFMAEVQSLVAAAWSMAAIPDFIHPQTRGERPAELEDALRFSTGLFRIAARDPDVHKLIMGVRHLLVPPAALRDPELVRRVEAELAKARRAAWQKAGLFEAFGLPPEPYAYTHGLAG